MLLKLCVDSDNLIEWDEMKDVYDDTYVNDATVTFTLKDADGDAVADAEDIPMPYVGNSNGKYNGTLQSTVVLVDGDTYYLEISATSGALVGFRRCQAVAQYRGAN